ncbi:N-acetyltransferase [Pilimelia terevasa]|uniref:N-acetyltransferase n=1 Tax=Pilimelia terevasa TaxID=53372 RepID=A0A8J3BH91_9ACTN|nr:GNAT family N-acetyltransferase [Pilimelia terevasa]GGK14768.1 N-acetyltransferase [Pilimelia terevasa]
MEIREATADDWSRIWPVLRDIVADGESYAFPADAPACAAIWYEAPPGRTVVAVDRGGALLGSAKMGPNRPGRGAHVATASFLVDPAARGRGCGRALGEYALDWARAAGYRGMQFNAVVETNTGAVALWRRLGFAVIGTVPEAFDSRRYGLVGLHVMYRRLGPDVPPRP